MKQKVVQSVQYARAGLYFLESLPLRAVDRLFFGPPKEELPDKKQFFSALEREVTSLIQQDSRLFAENHLPTDLLWMESPHTHLKTWLKVVLDSFSVAYRRRRGRHYDISEINKRQDEYPEYYLRNFHYQSGGYFGDWSASLYDHQVNLLFRGMTDAMRRLPLHQFLKTYPSTAPIKVLDVAAGTGRSSYFVKAAYPNAQITCLDLSGAYLKKAQHLFQRKEGVSFVQANGEELPFLDASFDIVMSTYLFHELPSRVRGAVLEESLRVLSPGGLLSISDSIQKGDVPEFDWSIEQFPKAFHEPFYRHYIEHSLLQIPVLKKLPVLQNRTGFLTKNIVLQKPV